MTFIPVLLDKVFRLQPSPDAVRRGRAPGERQGEGAVRAAPGRRPTARTRRGASSTEALITAGAAFLALGSFSQYGDTVKQKLACLGAQLEGSDIGCRDGSREDLIKSIRQLTGTQDQGNRGGQQPAPASQSMPAGGGTPPTGAPPADAVHPTDADLTKSTFRVTDDVDHNLVQNDEPGRNMEAAGNSTLTWVYNQKNAVGVCGNLADAMGLSRPELFSGGTCLQVGGQTFRVQDQLEDGQGCNGPASQQHLDFHHDVQQQFQDLINNPSADKGIDRVDCPDASNRTVFCPDGGNSAKLRFAGAKKPVKSAKIVDGPQGESLPAEGGYFRFNGLTAGQHTYEVTYSDGTTERFTLDTPSPSQLGGTQVPGSQKNGSGQERAGDICTFDIAPGEQATDRFGAANNRKSCISYLAGHEDATRAEAESQGHCAP